MIIGKRNRKKRQYQSIKADVIQIKRVVHIIVFLCFFLFTGYIHAQEQQMLIQDTQEKWIRFIAPIENAEVVDKKPEIKVQFLESIVLDTLIMLLDGTDVTQLLSVTENGFEYKPVMVLSAGLHTISITVTNKEGALIQKTISFTTRHSSTFEEAYTDNEVSGIYEQAVNKPADSMPDRKFEGNLRSDTKIKEKEWEFTFNTNLRYFDQSLPVTRPLKKGFDLANWIFKGSYTKDYFRLGTSIGDIQINETQYTVANLARRGGVFNLEYYDLQLNVFSVKSEQVFGLIGGAGIEGTTDDHILGVSGGIRLFDKKVQFKTIYVNGGEPGNSFGISTVSGAKKGEAVGFLLTTDLFENKLMTEFEADFSQFDPDTSDEFKSKSDHAYKIRLSGYLGKYSYEAMYEYIGRDYAVVGNQMIQRDKQGVSFVNSLNLGVHAVNLSLSRYNDNVKGDDLFPRIGNYQGNLDYSFNGIPSLPIGINYQKSVQDSTREPQGTTQLEIHTDSVSGRINYMKDRFNLGFQSSYSLMNDRTSSNNDTTTITYTLTPSYIMPNISIGSAFSLNQSKIHITNMKTDTYTINLDLRTKFLKDKGFFDVGSTYVITKADNGSIDNRNLNANFRLAYNIQKLLKGYFNPTVAIRGTYTNYRDKINWSSDRDELILLLVLATSIPFSF